MSLLLEYQWVLGVGALGALFIFILWRNRRDIYDFKSGVDTLWHGFLWSWKVYIGTIIIIALAWAGMSLVYEIATGSVSSQPDTRPSAPSVQPARQGL